jgi:hypothetical protein
MDVALGGRRAQPDVRVPERCLALVRLCGALDELQLSLELAVITEQRGVSDVRASVAPTRANRRTGPLQITRRKPLAPARRSRAAAAGDPHLIKRMMSLSVIPRGASTGAC